MEWPFDNSGNLACKGCAAYVGSRAAPLGLTCFGGPAAESGAAAARKLLERGRISREQYARLLEQDSLYRNTAKHGYPVQRVAGLPARPLLLAAAAPSGHVQAVRRAE